jgi:hypothetical protein
MHTHARTHKLGHVVCGRQEREERALVRKWGGRVGLKCAAAGRQGGGLHAPRRTPAPWQSRVRSAGHREGWQGRHKSRSADLLCQSTGRGGRRRLNCCGVSPGVSQPRKKRGSIIKRHHLARAERRGASRVAVSGVACACVARRTRARRTVRTRPPRAKGWPSTTSIIQVYTHRVPPAGAREVGKGTSLL